MDRQYAVDEDTREDTKEDWKWYGRWLEVVLISGAYLEKFGDAWI